jgi:hypothetical protein
LRTSSYRTRARVRKNKVADVRAREADLVGEWLIAGIRYRNVRGVRSCAYRLSIKRQQAWRNARRRGWRWWLLPDSGCVHDGGLARK